jgi:hypothetical protein
MSRALFQQGSIWMEENQRLKAPHDSLEPLKSRRA